MPYSAPTRAALRASVQRDLRDPDANAFTVQEVDDLVNQGILEASRVYPKEQVAALDVITDDQLEFDATAYALFRVEVQRDNEFLSTVPHNAHSESSQGGWDFHAEKLYLPGFMKGLVADTDAVMAWGYWPRETMHDDGDVLDGDAEMEYATRSVASVTGYQRLQSDRSLFQQWRTDPLNSDVSMNQLVQLADFYNSQWDRLRKRIHVVQRV